MAFVLISVSIASSFGPQVRLVPVVRRDLLSETWDLDLELLVKVIECSAIEIFVTILFVSFLYRPSPALPFDIHHSKIDILLFIHSWHSC